MAGDGAQQGQVVLYLTACDTHARSREGTPMVAGTRFTAPKGYPALAWGCGPLYHLNPKLPRWLVLEAQQVESGNDGARVFEASIMCDGSRNDALRYLHEHGAGGMPYLARRRKLGGDLYGVLGIPRGDKDRMARQLARNYTFFGAPVGLIFTIDRDLEMGSWLDYGIFLQGIMLAARGAGLDTCPQQAWVAFHKTVRAHLGLPDGWMVYSGLALGYEDPEAPINRWRAPREPLESFAVFDGFAG